MNTKLTKEELAKLRNAFEVHLEYGGAEPEDIAAKGLKLVAALEDICSSCESCKDAGGFILDLYDFFGLK